MTKDREIMTAVYVLGTLCLENPWRRIAIGVFLQKQMVSGRLDAGAAPGRVVLGAVLPRVVLKQATPRRTQADTAQMTGACNSQGLPRNSPFLCNSFSLSACLVHFFQQH